MRFNVISDIFPYSIILYWMEAILCSILDSVQIENVLNRGSPAGAD